MDVLTWVAEVARVLLDGGSLSDLNATHGFQMLVLVGLFLGTSTLIALGIGSTEWHETPLGAWLGARPKSDESWTERARDLDNDGHPDF